MASIKETFGLLQWFYFGERERVRETAKHYRALGLRNLRTGLSWAEFEADGGPEWFDYMVGTLAAAGIRILLMIGYTPEERSDNGSYTGAPKRLEDYADFVEMIVRRYGKQIDEIQLWNEPNNRHYWDIDRDSGWEKFGAMARLAARRCRALGMKTVLGGTIAGAGWAPLGQGWPPDASFYSAMYDTGVLDEVDAISFHSFPGMWVSGDPHAPDHPEWSWGEPDQLWPGWEKKVSAHHAFARGKEIVVAETGYSAFDWNARQPGNLDEQAIWIKRAAEAPARAYWYSLFDIAPGREMIGGEAGGDPRNPYFGLITHDGIPKPAYHVLSDLLGKDD